jgi:hypothetical protein
MIDHDILDEQHDVAESLARSDRNAIERRVPIAELECKHGYIGDGPCACFQLKTQRDFA